MALWVFDPNRQPERQFRAPPRTGMPRIYAGWVGGGAPSRWGYKTGTSSKTSWWERWSVRGGSQRRERL